MRLHDTGGVVSAVAQRNFAGGELAPANYGRTDQTKYATGLRTLRNMLIKRSGGVTNRPGTEYLTEVKDSSAAVRLIKYDNTDTFIIELGNLYARFLKSGVPVSPVGALDWDNVSFYGLGSVVLRLGVYYWGLQTNTNKPPESEPTYWYPMTGEIFEIPTPYVTADLAAIDYAQSGSTITLVHPSYAPRELIKASALDYHWLLDTIAFAPTAAAPTVPVLSGGIAGARTYWAITTIFPETFEESLPLLADDVDVIPDPATPTTVSWTPPSDFAFFNVYRSTDGVSYGLVGSTSSSSFSDVGATADLLQRPPQARDIMNATDKYPSAVTYYQQRRVFGNSNDEPETVWASRIAQYSNFGITFPLQDDDAVTFRMAGKRSNPVRHLLDLGRLIVFTSREEKLVGGDQAGILKPDAVNPQKLSANGCSTLAPLELDTTALYVQARGTKVRDLVPVSADSYEGTDLTVFASHLFDGYTIVAWDYAQNPHSIVWAARSDGTLLGLTYLREHAIWGWHRHDTDGSVEDVCVVPEGAEDRIYVVVKRTINGATKRYIERFVSRFFTAAEDAPFVDAAVTYDGRNTSATTLTLSSGFDWEDYTNDVNVSALPVLPATFSAGDVGSFIVFYDADGVEAFRISIDTLVGGDVVIGKPDKVVPAAFRGVATTSWGFARSAFAGLGHLEGKAVSALGDGFVAASPNNPDYPVVTVTGGVATFDTAYVAMRIGLPFVSDVVTLDLDAPGPSTIKDRKVLVNRLGIYLEASRGVWAGMPDQPTDDDLLNGLQELKARELEDYNEPTSAITDYVEINTEPNWNTNGRQMIRQVDPLPLTVLAIMPIGYLPA